MEQHLGDEYDGLITSVQKYGCYVELVDVFVEGLLPINALEQAAQAHCVYRENDHAVVAVFGGTRGRSRGSDGSGPARSKPPVTLSWKLGDRVRVRAERIDPIRRRVEFALGSSS